MSNSLPLATLLELARKKTDDATRRLGELTSAQTSATSKLDMLIEYRAEYMAQLDILMQAGMSSSRWRNFQSFIATLDGALSQQQAIVDQAAQRLDAGRDDWRNLKRRQSSFATLSQRAEVAEQRRQNKREQVANDEFAARQFRKRSSESAEAA